MLPVYISAKTNMSDKEAQELAWKAGLFACFVSGIMEIGGAFIGNVLRRKTPRAALLAPLAGIAITFICMGFVFRIFNNPVIALIPMFLIIISYPGLLCR
jgi:AGZA family xanthine/uracil permease-like MFS transporter